MASSHVGKAIRFYQTKKGLPYPQVSHVSYTTPDNVSHQACYDGLCREESDLENTFSIYASVNLSQHTKAFHWWEYLVGKNCVTFIIDELGLHNLNLPTLPGPFLHSFITHCKLSIFEEHPYYHD